MKPYHTNEQFAPSYSTILFLIPIICSISIISKDVMFEFCLIRNQQNVSGVVDL